MIVLKSDQLNVEFQTLGGALSSIKDKEGVEYLWQGDPTYWSGQAPVLFPICGSVRNDTVLYDKEDGSQKEVKIPRHGLVRKKEFTLVEQTDNSVTFAIEDDEEMYANYPYHFRLEITYTVTGKTIRTQYKIYNKESEKSMPYFIGGHPGFNCPLLDDEVYEDYYLEFEKPETCTVPKPFPETGMLDLKDRNSWLNNQKEIDLNYDFFSYDAVTLDELESRTVALRSRKHDKGLKLHFKEFPNLIVWSTLNKGPFIALEPWSGLSTSIEEGDRLEDKKDVKIIKPSDFDQIGFDIEIL
ncbi:aldose 1-epimerase family protein [Streptococcus sp. CF9-1]|uniref:aldose 1-epimerase family protein n=1 Tax=unclassified Streptococcus TaxID=2608887 RepID=UPI0020C8AC15|nr:MULTISPECIES: aldose 1-epimerase family protein [unclassified Streptococcus]MCP8993435.1 aldose 1-epimerase family protein [Streptococcus sp. CF9-3]MCP8996819.1 aldose 1-epimerase family protein [Streptococcus sp. CF9-1]